MESGKVRSVGRSVASVKAQNLSREAATLVRRSIHAKTAESATSYAPTLLERGSATVRATSRKRFDRKSNMPASRVAHQLHRRCLDKADAYDDEQPSARTHEKCRSCLSSSLRRPAPPLTMIRRSCAHLLTFLRIPGMGNPPAQNQRDLRDHRARAFTSRALAAEMPRDAGPFFPVLIAVREPRSA